MDPDKGASKPKHGTGSHRGVAMDRSHPFHPSFSFSPMNEDHKMLVDEVLRDFCGRVVVHLKKLNYQL